MVEKIISGGQTGVDRAALDAAIGLGIAHGGWLPAGRKTEAGPLPETYALVELAGDSYPERTRKNVIEAEATLIISHGELRGGSALTARLARQCGKPHLHVDLEALTQAEAARRIECWLRSHGPRVLNVAGPRASSDPAIYNEALALLRLVLAPPRVESGRGGPT